MEVTEQNEPTTSSEPTLTKAEIASAWTNSPALAPTDFKLGERTFPVLYLDYDAQIEFLALMEPLVGFVTSLAGSAGKFGIPDIAISAESLTVANLVKYLKKELPEMVRLMCNTTDPEITVRWVKQHAKSPWELATIVIKQIQRNNMIGEIARFFAQITVLIQNENPTKK